MDQEPLLPLAVTIDEEPAAVREALDQLDRLLATAAQGVHPATIGAETARRVRWQIESNGAAEWAMTIMAEADRAIRSIDHDADSYRRRIDEWQARETATARATVALMDVFLCDYQRRRRDADEKAKSLPLISGVVKSSAKGASWFIVDDAKVMAWAVKNCPDAVKVEHSLLKTPISAVTTIVIDTDADGNIVESKLVDRDGNTVPGVGIEAPTVTYKAVPL